MKHCLIANFELRKYVFGAIRGNKILAKMSIFTVLQNQLNFCMLGNNSYYYCRLLTSFSKLTCDHLLGNGRPLGSLVCCVSYIFITFPYGVPDQAWYLIVPISDICLPMCSLKKLSGTFSECQTYWIQIRGDWSGSKTVSKSC